MREVAAIAAAALTITVAGAADHVVERAAAGPAAAAPRGCDGTVELQAEGPEVEVSRFLTAIANEFKHNISEAETRALPVRGDENAFGIRY